MIRIKVTWRDGEDYKAWEEEARKARARLLEKYKATGKVPNLDSAIWRKYKELICRKVKKPRCAYCEAELPLANFPPHAEHYRPKGSVTVERNKITHTGYFWLAYEWDNLFLACHSCNCWHSDFDECPEKPSHPGKSCEFRVVGTRVVGPAENPDEWEEALKGESPLLLHPYYDSPEEHIEFTEAAVPAAKGGSARGAETIRVCHLDRITLTEKCLEFADDLARRRLHRLIENQGAPLIEETDPFQAWLKVGVPLALKRILEGGGVKVSSLSMAD